MNELEAAGIMARILDAPRVRHFPMLGWAIVAIPMDMNRELGLGGMDRGLARMIFGTWWDFKPEEVTSLRARNLALDDQPARPCWILAIPEAAMELRRSAAISRTAE